MRRDKLQDSITDETFMAVVLSIAEKEATVAERNQYAIQPPSASWLRRARKKFLPRTLKSPNVQNERRSEVARDVLNFVSLAAVRGAMGDVLPECTINLDKTSLFLKDRIPTAYATKRSMVSQKERGQGAGITMNTTKSRTIKLLIATSAAGTVVGAVAEIRDRNLSRI